MLKDSKTWIHFFSLHLCTGKVASVMSHSLPPYGFQPGDLPDPEIEPMFLTSLPFILGYFTSSGTWEVPIFSVYSNNYLSNSIEMQASLVAQRLKHLPEMQETWVQSLSLEDPLEKEMATHSSPLACRISWREEPGRLQSMGSQRVRHDWATPPHFTIEMQYQYSVPLNFHEI